MTHTPPDLTDDTTATILDHLIAEETTATIKRMLTPREIVVIALKADGLSDKAIAEEAGMTVSAVRSVIVKIRRRVEERTT